MNRNNLQSTQPKPSKDLYAILEITKTATDEEIAKCQKCLQQYNFGIGQGAAKIKRAYALTSSGGNKGIRK